MLNTSEEIRVQTILFTSEMRICGGNIAAESIGKFQKSNQCYANSKNEIKWKAKRERENNIREPIECGPSKVSVCLLKILKVDYVILQYFGCCGGSKYGEKLI